MRTIPTTVTAVLACLLMGVTATGCTDGGPAEPSADQLLDDANATMRALRSVTIATVTRTTGGDDLTTRLTTDLEGTCTFKASSASGAAIEQIRIDGTDYVRPNRAYLEESGRRMSRPGKQDRWIKTSADESQPGDGLSRCTHEFASFGRAEKGEPAEVDGTPAITLKVTDDKDGTFTFYIAAEGKPYILKAVYKDARLQTTTSFSAFDKPLDVRPPDKAKVLDMTGLGS
ncbi:hypothetical protein GCM10009601_56750 [Streptomyces thermospinosisporus]|uniref:Lipoprotein n=1 Tax=Streptomyces thermospinosisporus TaxID=161482 RepID=A0ABN1Z750_9ACTN